MRIPVIVALFIAVVCALSGCVDYTEEVWLHPDGTASIHYDMAVKDMVAALGGGDDTRLPWEGEKDFSDGSGKSWTERTDGRVIRHVEEAISDVRQSHKLAPGHTGLGKLSPDWYSVEPLGLGRYRLQRTIKFPGQNEAPGAKTDNGNPLSQLGSSLGRSLIEQQMAGHQFSVTLHAPWILASNADTKEGMGTAVWKRDMAVLMRPDSPPLTIEATVLLVDWRIVVASGGGFLVLLVVLGVVAVRRRRKTVPAPAT